MKMSTTAPCPAGAAMIRDDRAWHGGKLYSAATLQLPLLRYWYAALAAVHCHLDPVQDKQTNMSDRWYKKRERV